MTCYEYLRKKTNGKTYNRLKNYLYAVEHNDTDGFHDYMDAIKKKRRPDSWRYNKPCE